VERDDGHVRLGAEGGDVFAEADEVEGVDAGIVRLVVAIALVVGIGEEAELDALAFEDDAGAGGGFGAGGAGDGDFVLFGRSRV
jgi:hypothetical protein